MNVNKYKNTPQNKNRPSSHPLYRCWASMKNRCYNQNDKLNYEEYGSRGIKVCERWLGKNGFWNFVEDMGQKPKGYSIDRIDVDGDYEPSNCRWASPKEQAYNRRNCLVFVIDGKAYNTEEAAKILGKHPETLRIRKRKGFSNKEIVSKDDIRRLKKTVICVETGEKFDSIMAAGRAYNISYQVIASCLHGRGKTAAGKHWEFAENWPEVQKELTEILR